MYTKLITIFVYLQLKYKMYSVYLQINYKFIYIYLQFKSYNEITKNDSLFFNIK